MITYANDYLKEEVRKIWKISFPEDSNDFIDFYFNKKYRNENTLIYLEDNQAVACLQMLPYDFTFFGHNIPSAYISGAATLPKHQNKGIMKKLLTAAFLEMRKNNIPLTTLIPQEEWLIKFYERTGYSNSFVYSKEKLATNHTYSVANQYNIAPISKKEKAYAYYRSFFSKQNLCIQKNEEDFNAIITFYEIEKGEIISAEINNQIKGLCFINELDNKITIKDFIYSDTEAKNAILNYLFIKYASYETEIIRPCNATANSTINGMARIINSDLFLSIYAKAHPNIAIAFTSIDKQLPANNAHYIINNGTIKKTNTPSDFTIDINLLTRLLLGYKTNELAAPYAIFPTYYPYMSLMLE